MSNWKKIHESLPEDNPVEGRQLTHSEFVLLRYEDNPPYVGYADFLFGDFHSMVSNSTGEQSLADQWCEIPS